MNNIKLIALDIDGTIMKKDFTISQRVKDTVKKAINSGIKVVLATGRMYSSTIPIAEELGIKEYVINYQGGMITDLTSHLKLLSHSVSTEHARLIIDELRNFDVQINLYIDDKLIVEHESTILKEYSDKRFVEYNKVSSFDDLASPMPTKLMGIDTNHSKIDEITDYLKNKYSDRLFITKSTPEYCEIANIKATKGNAVLHLADKWNISKNEIMAIGDQDNDIEMLKAVGLPIAMGNATEGLKDVAKHITEHVHNDGVAVAIEKFAL